MVNKTLVEYLKRGITKGYSLSSLRKALINQNHDKAEIEEAIKFIDIEKKGVKKEGTKTPLEIKLSEIPPEIRDKKIFMNWLKDKIKENYDIEFIIKKLKEYDYNLDLVDKFLESRGKYGLQKEVRKLREIITDKEFKERRAFYFEWLISLSILIIAFIFSAHQMSKIQLEYIEISFFNTMGFWFWIIAVISLGILIYVAIMFIRLIFKRKKEMLRKTSMHMKK